MTRTRNISDLLDSNGDVKSGSLDNVPAVDLTNLSATNLTSGTIPAARFPSTIDGRDLSTDGTKLDGIEASATADQTASEIRALVESASDSNVFTDADHTKLNGIEASADVTDATNVASAGALMTSGGTVTGNVTVNGDVVLNDGSPNLRLQDSDVSRFVDIMYGTRVSTIRNTMASGEDMDTVEPSMVFSFKDDGETRTAVTIDHDGNLNVTGAITGDGSGLTNLPPSGLPSGTKALFVQTAAPTGWTKDTTHNNKALRIVSGSVGTGGSSSFTSALGTPSLSISISGSTGSTTISTSTMPSHKHSLKWGTGGGAKWGNPPYHNTVAGFNQTTAAGNAYMSYNTSGSMDVMMNNNGSGGSHNHSLSASASGTAAINVQYVDVIIATKD